MTTIFRLCRFVLTIWIIGWTLLVAALPDQHIKQAQQYLQQLGFNPGVVDGVMGAKTTTAVKAFQHSLGISETGILDEDTIRALTEASRKHARLEKDKRLKTQLEEVILAENWTGVLDLLSTSGDEDIPLAFRRIQGYAHRALNQNYLAEQILSNQLSPDDQLQWKTWVEEFAGQHPQQAIAFYFQGDVAFTAQQYEMAVEVLSQGLTLYPDYDALWMKQGDAFQAQKQYLEAIFSYTEAIKRTPTSAYAYTQRGICYAQKQLYPQALEDYTRAVELDPGYLSAYMHRGTTYMTQMNWDQGLIEYTAALSVAPNYAQAYFGRGICYEAKEFYEEAIQDYTRAIELHFEQNLVYYRRGVLYNIQQKYAEAIADFSKAIEIDPEDPQAYVGRGIAYNNTAQYVEAVVDCYKSISLDPGRVDAYLCRGSTYSNMMYYDRAIADFDVVLATQDLSLSEQFEAYAGRGYCYLKKRKYTQALTDLEQALVTVPNHQQAEQIKRFRDTAKQQLFNTSN